jgi:hypothetical protein
MCCLKYEQDAYEDLIRNSPKLESFVDTPDGRGTVIELNLLRQQVKVRMEDRPEVTGVFRNEEIAILRSGKAKKTDAPIPADLAPISGKGKRVKEVEENKEPTFLDPIRFRYSTEAVVEEPEILEDEDVAEEIAEEADTPQKNKRRRNRKPKSQEQSAQTTPEKKPEQPKKQPRKVETKEQTEQKADQKPESKEGQDAPAKKRHYNHHRRRKSKSGNGEKPAN